MAARTTVVVVKSTATELTQVAPGHTVLVQNLSSKAVTIAVNQQPSAGQGIVLAGGTPGQSFRTTPPGTPTWQTWYAIVATGTATVAVLVI